ncbi:hypothetical protein PRIPAC_93509 [Pristionchus pacificus]|uniref:Uncharacterized protein n=1 Tax=Pristionchus pacificus TaxID=54126 RepID=A0A2A6BIY1_PRIPA|nr:hypothetical protein PRIPAC_93509 [Pristionchus pacificus]|eukprot:PDM65870.1 hypothetical protein PRIPAC_44149 [Pristionchus pacificus]
MAEAPENKTISARDVITNYSKGDVQAILLYKKICNAFDLVEKWDENASRQFLSQILDIGDLLDHTCKTLVENIIKLKWTKVPMDLRMRWRNLLCEIGVKHVVHLEKIYQCAIRAFLPEESVNEKGEASPALSEDQQAELFGMAHSIVNQLLIVIPVSAKMASKMLNRYFPYQSSPVFKTTAYIRNLINASEYASVIREEIWGIIIDNLVNFDSLISRDTCGDDSGAEIFMLDEDEENSRASAVMEECNPDQMAKLDQAMRDIIDYVHSSHSIEIDDEAAAWMHCSGKVESESVFNAIHSSLMRHLLNAPTVRYVSFLWLFLASLKEEYTERVLSSLWECLIRPSSLDGEAKKSQGAASYLAAFISRAKYIDIRMAQTYLARMAAYLCSYVDRVGLSSRTIVPGLSHHGVFYAMANAFFLAFSFRYREIVKSGGLDEVRHWGIARFIHSSLDPLKYSIVSVGRCFAAVSRSLQLVYCSHVLPLAMTEFNRPFDPCNPFDAYFLQKTVSLITPLTRKFSPMKEDADNLTREISMSKGEKKKEEESAIDFLDEDEDMDYGSPKSLGPLSNGLFTVYSTSPGLRPFQSGSPMDMR